MRQPSLFRSQYLSHFVEIQTVLTCAPVTWSHRATWSIDQAELFHKSLSPQFFKSLAPPLRTSNFFPITKKLTRGKCFETVGHPQEDWRQKPAPLFEKTLTANPAENTRGPKDQQHPFWVQFFSNQMTRKKTCPRNKHISIHRQAPSYTFSPATCSSKCNFLTNMMTK